MRHAVRAARALALLGLTACSARDYAPPSFDFDPDTGTTIDSLDTIDAIATDAATDDVFDATVVDDTATPDTASADVYVETWHAYDANCFLESSADADPDTVSDGPDATDASGADVFVSAPRTCVCFFEDPMTYPCLPPCISSLDNEANGCVPGPLPPPDLPSTDVV